VTLKGLVFIWMGENEPVPPEDDIPPEFFEKGSVVLNTFRYWDCNWMIALENTGDAHNQWFVHRNSFRVARSGRSSRTPVGSRPRIVNNQTVERPNGRERQPYYADESGKVPYKFYHPRVNAYWPLYRRRLLWTWFFDAWNRLRPKRGRFFNVPGWEGQRLPGLVRNNHLTHMYTRWPVPVDENLSRVVYFFSARPSNWLGRLYDRVTFHLFLNWMINYNFSDQDYDAMRSARYQYPEYLSSTDSVVVALRRLVSEHGRGIKHDVEVVEETTAERLVAAAEQAFAVKTDDVVKPD
jgi:phenylpropionate dioxygenase-like ring-hydroxylating dioxygenase large terminal subunit